MHGPSRIMNAKIVIGASAAVVIVLLAIQNRHKNGPRPSEPVGSRSVKTVAKPHLPAPRRAAVAASIEESPDDRRSTNLLVRVLRGEEPPKLTLEQIGPYLEANRRSVESLLAASRTTGDRTFLQEAKEKYPNDPRVAFDALIWSKPEERRQWLDTFKQSAPDNALPNYLSALEHFKSGQTDQAVQDLS